MSAEKFFEAKFLWRVMASFVLAVGILTAVLARAADETVVPKSKGAGFTYDPHGQRDPFVPLVRDGRLVATTPGMRLESSKPVLAGILWDPGGQSVAIINEEEVKVGDAIGGYKVSEIRKDAVVLTNGGKLVELGISFDTPPAEASKRRTTTGGEGR